VIRGGAIRSGDRYGGVIAFRRVLIGHYRLAAMLVAIALLMKLVVPAGYMVSGEHGRFQVMLCSGVAPRAMTLDVMAQHAGMTHHGPAKQHEQGSKAEMPCAFAGLALHAIGGADPILLAVALAFVAALALCPTLPVAPRARAYVRPPLRGPPACL
jgi:hypothetical protein